MFCTVSSGRHHPQEVEETKNCSKDQQTVATVDAACPCQDLQRYAEGDQCAGPKSGPTAFVNPHLQVHQEDDAGEGGNSGQVNTLSLAIASNLAKSHQGDHTSCQAMPQCLKHPLREKEQYITLPKRECFRIQLRILLDTDRPEVLHMSPLRLDFAERIPGEISVEASSPAQRQRTQ